jgi:hypothetical protein
VLSIHRTRRIAMQVTPIARERNEINHRSTPITESLDHEPRPQGAVIPVSSHHHGTASYGRGSQEGCFSTLVPQITHGSPKLALFVLSCVNSCKVTPVTT